MNTEQETFDYVVHHLRNQDRQSRENGKCAYRGAAGRMCAVGCLIPDNLYDKKMENVVSLELPQRFTVPQELSVYSNLLQSLQDLHDSDEYGSDGFAGIEDSVKTLANLHGLVYNDFGL